MHHNVYCGKARRKYTMQREECALATAPSRLPRPKQRRTAAWERGTQTINVQSSDACCCSCCCSCCRSGAVGRSEELERSSAVESSQKIVVCNTARRVWAQISGIQLVGSVKRSKIRSTQSSNNHLSVDTTWEGVGLDHENAPTEQQPNNTVVQWKNMLLITCGPTPKGVVDSMQKGSGSDKVN